MRREQIAEAYTAQKRLNDEEMSRRWTSYERTSAGICFDFFQSAGQRIGIARPVGSSIVSAVFAGA